MTGSRLPAFRIASKTPTVAIFACSRSCAVSISSTSTPPSISASGLLFVGCTMSSNPMCPSDGSLVVGPIEPATKRGLSFVENCCATSFAIFAAAMLISRPGPAGRIQPRTIAGAAESVGLDHVAADVEEVGVNVTMMSGRLSTRTSLQFFFAPVIIQTWGCGSGCWCPSRRRRRRRALHGL